MKISTKFITSSAVVVAVISALLLGDEILLKQADDYGKINYERTNKQLRAIFNSESFLKEEVRSLKDFVVLNRQATYMAQYQKAMANFLFSLDELERLLPTNLDLAPIRQRQNFLNDLAKSITNKSINDTQYQQDFITINSFRDEIVFYFNALESPLKKQSDLDQEREIKIKQTANLIRIIIMGITILVFIGQFVLMILPVVRSIEKLKQGVLILEMGNLDYRLKINTGDEIEKLAHEFNLMAERLAESYHCLKQEISDRQLTENELQQAIQKLQETQAQLIQTEKMSSLGNTVAGVAHEINNPISFIYGNLTYVDEYTQSLLDLVYLYQRYYPNSDPIIQEYIEEIDLDFLSQDLSKILSSMKVGAERISQIVLSLRNFTRLDESEMKEVDIHAGIDSTLRLLENKLAGASIPIQIVTKYGKLPLVECYAGELNQVFMNIIINAIEALEEKFNKCNLDKPLVQNGKSESEKPEIRIRTKVLGSDRVVVLITDNGTGMTENVSRKLFEPFFTTKKVGQGTGLGLFVSYQIIVQKHSGELRCNSTLEKGTEFWIEIPVRQKHQHPNYTITHSAPISSGM